MKTTCYIKLKFFFWTKLPKNVLLAKYLISVTATLNLRQKKFEGDLKIKLHGKRLDPTENVKYLGVKIVTNISQQYHVNDIKLNRPTAILFKIRRY